MREQLYDLVRSYIEKCNRCGDCRAVCPVFGEEGTETALSRGKLLLAGRILSGELAPSPDLLERLDKCLLCESCTFGCGFHIRVDQVMMATRAYVAEEIGLPAAKNVVFNLLADHRGTMGLICAAGAVAAPIWGRRVSQDSGLRLRFPVVPGLPSDRVLPRPAARSFLRQAPAVKPAQGAEKTVAFFAGCYINYVLPSVGNDVLSLLNRAGVSVKIVKEQQCCGTPMAASGDLPRALRLMEANLKALGGQDVDAVVTACATCGTALRELYPKMLARLRPELQQEAEDLASKTVDITEFLTAVAPIPGRAALKHKMRITYHDSCHIVRGLGVKSQPRRLLEKVENLDLVEMENSDVCCGGAGAFSLTQQQLSRQILGHKVESIVATSADTVVSGCHGCNLQIEDGLSRAGAPTRTIHIVQLLEKAYREGSQANET